MADITMCASENCPRKQECYRTTAKPDNWQSWSDFGSVCNEKNCFEYLIKTKEDIRL